MKQLIYSRIKVGGRSAMGSMPVITLLAAAVFLLGAVTMVVAQTAPAEVPDAGNGLQTYEERCANCHGTTGLGDGELAAGLPNPPTAHASPEYLRGAVPSEMFALISGGRVEAGMPPFGPDSSNPLTEQQIWDAVASIYSLGTPVDSLNAGQALYEGMCLDCHGESGAGDGPGASSLASAPGDLSDAGFWAGQSSQSLYDALSGGQISGHDFPLDDNELWAVVDYVRSFGYNYVDAQARFRPVERGSVSGMVVNGTTGEAIAGGLEARLRAFTRDLEVTLDITTTVGVGGLYQFDLSEVPQDWFMRVGVTYQDVEFGSDFAQLTFSEPDVTLPVTVYDPSTDPSTVFIEQLHIVLAFAGDRVNVSELYVAGNDSPTVFVGDSGDPANGVFEIPIPDNAENLAFQRGFGSVSSFIPAAEVVQVGEMWADTLPLRPGPGTLNMLVQYSLPYQDQGSIVHPVSYEVDSINLVVPDAGVAVDLGDGWTSTGEQAMGETMVVTYGQNNLPANSVLSINLEGSVTSPSASASRFVSDNATELAVGIGAAAIVLVVAFFALRQWRGETIAPMDRAALLQTIADLDVEFEQGYIDEDEYTREREELMAELREIWQDEA